jgi:hypothetical protein
MRWGTPPSSVNWALGLCKTTLQRIDELIDEEEKLLMEAGILPKHPKT